MKLTKSSKIHALAWIFLFQIVLDYLMKKHIKNTVKIIHYGIWALCLPCVLSPSLAEIKLLFTVNLLSMIGYKPCVFIVRQGEERLLSSS